MTVTQEMMAPVEKTLWLDLTRKCQLNCSHCFNESGPEGTHGTMTRDDWLNALSQAADCGFRIIRFIGGEPTMHPNAPELVRHAISLGLRAEVYSNLVHVTAEWWELFQCEGVSLATSYYSDDASEHNALTGRPSHRHTRANIEKAVQLGIPVRAGIVAASQDQRVDEARGDLEALGVFNHQLDRVRAFGRGANGRTPDVAELCSRCGNGKAAIGPDGNVSPCVFSLPWMEVGNVHETPLADILNGTAMAEANASIRAVTVRSDGCDPDEECSPGSPGSGCGPRN
ncbi:radical SAM protein [Spirillospora sp. CA-294931]|uniref:radical SAM protein n=1 Tax=Spirillospora sp. CA-294931 TaxID=3240042 RepID=UPI003D8DFCF6